jgi:hypothetical protein
MMKAILREGECLEVPLQSKGYKLLNRMIKRSVSIGIRTLVFTKEVLDFQI